MSTPTVAKTITKKKKRRFNKWLAIASAVVVFGLAANAWKKKGEAEEVHAEVKTALVERGDVSATASANGKLLAFTTVDVKSKAGGKVIKMAVEEGTKVSRGDLIAVIDRTDTTAAYRQAAADAAVAEGAVTSSQATLRQQRASVGPQVRQAGESVSSAQARLAQAQESLKLQSETNGPAIRQAEQAVAASQARVAQAQEALDLQRKTSETAVQEAQSGIDAAQARLSQAETQAKTQPELSQGQIAQAQAQVDAAEASLSASRESLGLLTSASQPQATARAQADVNQAKSSVETARMNLTRLQGLLTKGFVAQTQVDAAQNTLVTAQSSLETSQAVLNTIKEQQAAEVREAKARVQQSQGSLNQAKAALSNAKSNTIQDTLRQQDVLSAQAALRQAQSGLQNAIANRQQVALKQADLNATRAALKQAQASLVSARANTRQISLKRSDVNAAAAAVRQAQASLANTQTQTITSQARAADVQQAQARLERARVTQRNAATNLSETRVVAPRDGIVLQKYVDEGTIIQSGTSGFSGGTAIVQLAQVDRMYVDAQVDEADIALIAEEQSVEITLDAYPNSPRAGKVRKVFPQAAEEQNVTYVHVQVEVDSMDVDERLRPGMNATCEFLVDSASNVLRVPTEAVKDVNDATEVTVIKDPKKDLWDTTNHEKRSVEVGVRGDDWTEILLPSEDKPAEPPANAADGNTAAPPMAQGLKEGDTVVTQITEPIVTGTSSGSPGGASSAPRGPTGGMGGGGRNRF